MAEMTRLYNLENREEHKTGHGEHIEHRERMSEHLRQRLIMDFWTKVVQTR